MVLLELPHRPVVEIEGMLLKPLYKILPLTIRDEEVTIYIIDELEVLGGLLKVKSPALSLFYIIKALRNTFEVKALDRGVVAVVVRFDELQRNAGSGMLLVVV